MKKTKTTLLHSVIALLLCISMLIGSTFAWFSDRVSSTQNIITSGNLDLEMYWTDDLDSGEWFNVEEEKYKTIFNYDNWEPGYTDVKYIKLVNKGDLALNYKLSIEPQSGVGKLAEVINVYYANDGIEVASRDDLAKMSAIGLLNNVMNGGATANGTLLAADQYSPLHTSGETIITLAMSMITTAGNDYQNEDAGEFTINALATQAPFEKDSFGSDYDANAEYPVILKKGSATADVVPVDGKVPVGGVTLSGDGISAVVPEGTLLEEGVDKLTLTVTPLKNTTSDITVVNNEVLIPVDVHIDGISENNTTPILIDLGEVLPKYLNMGNYHLFHMEDGQSKVMTLVDDKEELNAHNQFTYDSDTGAVTVAMASFSEVVGVADTSNPWKGEEDYLWYNTTDTSFTITKADQLYAFAKIVGGMAKDKDGNAIAKDSFTGKTVKLLSDINLNHGKFVPEDKGGITKIFYPIGYYNKINDSTSEYYDRVAEVKGQEGVTSNVSSFSGTFDGNGHKISNFYQNTWEMFGDYNSGYSGKPNYYKDAMGLFGYVNGGTVKNLTVDHFESDGEFTPTGVIAAYADGNATFENIAITKCNPRVYNTGNGGIIGVAGDTSAKNDDHITLKNITLDNSNKISALWGSYDVACGGLVGMYRGNVDGSGNATGDTISFDNCHVSAQMDVYNDVCGNYQYYAYRYAGMIIGSIRHNTTNADGKTIPNMTGISARDCTVNYGDWNDYYYCEFEKNSMASYSEDYQFSRVPHSELNFTDSNGNGLVDADERSSVTGCKHDHTPAEDKKAVYLPFHQLFTGYSWGVSSIGLEKYSGIVTNLGITEGDQNASDLKFDCAFPNSRVNDNGVVQTEFLYRVGNQNTVSVGDLFIAKSGVTINSSGVVVSIDKVDENSNVSGAFTAKTDDWTKGTIQFSGTGVVKVTIQDYNFCTPIVLYLEVIDATNLTSATGTTNGGAFVLVRDVNTTSYVNYWNCTLYGNGFTYSLKGAPTAYNSKQGHGVIITKNATLDNLKIIGDVYNSYGAYTNQDYYNTAIDVVGDTTIQNCYIANCAAPVKARSNVTFKNTTLYGGAVANLLIMSGTATLENVTTVNYDDGSRSVVGMGIVVHSDATESAKLTLNGKLTQYNFISESKVPTDSYAKNLHDAMFDEQCNQYHFGTKPNRYVNTGIISLTSVFDGDDITDNAKTDYVGKALKVTSYNGYVYTQLNTSGSVNNNFDTYSSTTQGAVPPQYSFDYTIKNYLAKTEGSNDYCYEENGTVHISMDEGDTFNWDTSILNVQKEGKALNYTVTMNGIDYTNKSIDFKTAGDYTVTYTYTDDKNYTTDEKGVISTYSVTYDKTVSITVAVVKATTKHAEFTFGSSNTASTTVTVGNNTYVMPNVTGTSSTIGSTTVDGKTIYYPIVEIIMSDSTDSHTSDWYAYFPVFSGAVTITDYADKGTGDKMTPYNGSTTAMPSGLSVVGDPTQLFKYQSSSAAGSTPVVKNNKLVYSSPSISAKRNEYNTVIQYSYTDNAGATYYYYIGYHADAQTYTNCITPDTFITLSDGSQVRVDSLTGSEQLLVWNMETGSLDSAPIMFVDSDPEATYEVIKLYFSDGTEVKVISEHGFWDYDLNRYVYLDRNAAEYMGHTFAKQNGDVLEKVQLIDVILENQVTTAWSPVTAGHLCYFVNGMLSMPGGVGGLFNIFDVDVETMTYDYEAMARDIETYGLFTYEELSQYADLSKEMFDAAGGQFLKVSIGKGNMTMNELVMMIERYSKFFES